MIRGMIQSMGKTKEEVIEMMRSCTFTDTLIFGPVGSLSGGWRMRLALSRAMLKEPELLLLDEPTNHVDVHGVAWLTKYIQDLSEKKISSMIVSHDTVFLDNVAQDCVHYEKNRKLKVYKGNLSEFVKLVPEAAAYYCLESDNVAFSFPDPGMLEGVTSKTKALMKMTDCSFKCPSRDVNTLNNISIQVSMASRVAVIGVNGAGKSTMIKMLTGELSPNEGQGKGDVTRHPNKRPAYDCGPALTKLMMQVDERIAFEASGIATKKLTQLNIQKHLDNFNLETQFGTYSKIS